MINTALTFSIKGMKCGGCVSAVETALNELGNVDDITVSLEQHQASVSSSRPADEIAQAITAAGFPATAI